MNARLSAEQRDEIVARYQRADKLEAVAAEYGVTASYVRLLAADRGIPGRTRAGRPRLQLTQEQKNEIAALYGDASVPTMEIARRFGIGKNMPRVIAKRRGITRGRLRPSAHPWWCPPCASMHAPGSPRCKVVRSRVWK